MLTKKSGALGFLILLSKIARQDVELCPVLSNRSSSYWYTSIGKDFHNLFVAERIPRVFVAHQFGDRLFDTGVAERSAARRLIAGRKEVFHFEYPLGRRHIFA